MWQRGNGATLFLKQALPGNGATRQRGFRQSVANMWQRGNVATPLFWQTPTYAHWILRQHQGSAKQAVSYFFVSGKNLLRDYKIDQKAKKTSKIAKYTIISSQ